MLELDYDDHNLQRLFEELDPKQRLKAFRGAFRREANRVRKIAISHLRSSINSNRELEKGVRTVVWKQKAGFRITVGTKRAGKSGKGAAGYYRSKRNKNGREVPVLVWMDAGTDARYQRGGWGHRKKRYLGRIENHGFIEKAKREGLPQSTENLRKEIVENIQKVAKKYGCT